MLAYSKAGPKQFGSLSNCFSGFWVLSFACIAPSYYFIYGEAGGTAQGIYSYTS